VYSILLALLAYGSSPAPRRWCGAPARDAGPRTAVHAAPRRDPLPRLRVDGPYSDGMAAYDYRCRTLRGQSSRCAGRCPLPRSRPLPGGAPRRSADLVGGGGRGRARVGQCVGAPPGPPRVAAAVAAAADEGSRRLSTKGGRGRSPGKVQRRDRGGMSPESDPTSVEDEKTMRDRLNDAREALVDRRERLATYLIDRKASLRRAARAGGRTAPLRRAGRHGRSRSGITRRGGPRRLGVAQGSDGSDAGTVAKAVAPTSATAPTPVRRVSVWSPSPRPPW
jgi:hypothetical protein